MGLLGKEKKEEDTVLSPPENKIAVTFNLDMDIARGIVGVGDEEAQGLFMEKAIAKALIDQKIKEVELLQEKAKGLM